MTEDEEMRREAIRKLHLHYWTEYEDVLRFIKICDPACGSGAFLNQCFDCLHEEMDFVLGMKEQLSSQIFEELNIDYEIEMQNQEYLQDSLFDIDKEILQNNLYGVDINPESVEITKLSLWLKTAKKDQTLASLDNNIKCGNSIVADKSIVNNAFVWEEEFSDVFANGGFDIVVGNPPYGAKLDEAQKSYLLRNYNTTEYNFDTYKTFYELGMNITKIDGYLGYITPNTYFSLELGANKLRHFLFNYILREIVEIYNVFPSAVVEPVITIYQKRSPSNEKLYSICLPRKIKPSSTFLNEGVKSEFSQSDLRKNDQLLFNYRSSKQDQKLCEEMDRFPRLNTLFGVMTGAKPYQIGKGIPPQTKAVVHSKPFTGLNKLDDTWIPYLRGRCIERFTNCWSGKKEYIKYGEWLAEPRLPEVFEGEKLFIRQTGDSIIATYDKGNVSNNTLHSVYALSNNKDVSLYYLLGLLNSTLLNWYYKTVHYLEVGKPMAEVKGVFIKKLPIAIGNIDQYHNIETMVSNLLLCCRKRFEIKDQFVNFINRAYEPIRITGKLECFDSLSFKDFCAELKKQKVKLSASAQMDLLPLFDAKVKEIAAVTTQINALQLQLDELVFQIYEIDSASAEKIKSEMVVTI